MKKSVLWLLLCLVGMTTLAQRSNLVFFSEQGERFLLVLNGIQQNGDPETNVKITDLPATTYKVKVIFEDPKLPEMDKSVFMEPGYEYTCNIKKNQKGEYVIRLLSQVVLEQAPPPAPAQKVYLYTTTPAVATASVTTTTTSVTIGVGVATSSTTQTVTSSVGVTEHGEEVYVMPGYNGPYGCRYPMHDGDFQVAKTSISSKSFEDDKLTVAKQVTGANCLLCSQIRQIMTLFSFEETRLEYAKFAFAYAFDQGNYYQLNDAFQFSSSIGELDEYINGRK
jgi:hypothetical protein